MSCDPEKPVRTAVIGVGYLGRFHAQKYARMEDVELVGVVDMSIDRAEKVAAEVGTAAFTDFRELMGGIDAASVVVPTVYHYDVARPLLQSGIHCMLEKPITTTVEEADDLIETARSKGLVLQVGHLERFNPAIQLLEERVKNPFFIEAHRLSGFKDRATDVDVVLDLMIHDLEIILAITDSRVREIRAVGVPVLTGKVDIANARIIFENSCTANVTASRISLQDMRRIRVFQPSIYVAADCVKRNSMVVMADPGADDLRAAIKPEFFSHGDVDILFDELYSFIRAVRGLEPPRVSGESGRNALSLALDINSQIVEGLKTARAEGVI
ncbi:MAG TPA: Gfo/Idh/MocA family oxidoreductase [Thermodesulfobacteriaceae bacterium]|nr:Gfo/Idh/MocA family oxidoreductase [Thermodesulfobacteriaceae bacterium]